MANCPKCGKHLHFYNVSQFCPECGTNMNFYGFVDNFYREAKLAELSQAKVHVMIKHIKAAYIGSKLAIARLIVCLLPAVGFLIPSGKFGFNVPFVDSSFDFSGLGIYNLFNAGGLDYVLGMMNSSFAGAEFKAFAVAAVVYALAAVMAVLVLLFSLLCLFSYKNMQKITCVLAALGFVSCAAAEIFVLRFVSACKDSLLLQAKNGFGLLVAAAMFIAVFIVNLLLWRKGIPVEYDEGMLERNEIYHKVKRGEINLDDLPQPVVETAATRAIDEEIEKQTREFNEKHTEEQEVTA